MLYIKTFDSGSKNDKLAQFLLATIPDSKEASDNTVLTNKDYKLVCALGRNDLPQAEANHIYVHENVNAENTVIKNETNPQKKVYYIGVKKDTPIEEMAEHIQNSLRTIDPELKDRSLEVTSEFAGIRATV